MEFERIYRTYFKSVYLYALGLSGDEQLAEEITGETFFKAIHAIDSFRGDCEVRVWLCQIAKNTYYTFVKEKKRTISADEAQLQYVADPAAAVDARLSEQEEAHQIRVILHNMPEPYKAVFMWRVFGELTFQEIGELYGKTDNWACVTYHRARKMITKKMGGNRT